MPEEVPPTTVQKPPAAPRRPSTVRGQIGQTRGLRFKLQHAIEDVDDQIALIRARVATWERAKATQVWAQAEFDRAKQLLVTKVWTQQDYDQRREQLEVASAAQLGVVPTSYEFTPKQILEEFYRRDPGGDVNKIFAEIIRTAPALKDAEAKLLQTERDLDEAKLNRRYCTVVAEIDGVITRRNVNPGNNVQAGQTLMAIRSLRDTWIDANFKETQLRNLRIGQRVTIEADMYGGRRTFEGRISGFTFGTGSTLALLPPQNATGNFVKVVQRLPVRIELLNYDPDKLPLFVGLSVKPTVDLRSEPTGPNAGQFLQALISASPSSPSATAENQ
jgi:membrane fusion protein (multidrug efflux system)